MQQLFRTWIAALAVLVTVTISAFAFAENDGVQDEETKAKHTIKQVMAKAMSPKGDQLNKKVLSGEASDAEKLELLDLFISLTENEPKKGDADSWNQFSSAAAMAAAKVAVGREGAMDELKAATNCSKCHKAHK